MKKVCVNCQFSDGNQSFATCSVSQIMRTDVVTGKDTPRWEYCSVQRMGTSLGAYIFGTCGPQARWFKERA